MIVHDIFGHRRIQQVCLENLPHAVSVESVQSLRIHCSIDVSRGL